MNDIFHENEEVYEKAFQDLKIAFTTTPLLIHVHLSKLSILNWMSLTFIGLDDVLSYIGRMRYLHQVVFYSQFFLTLEFNYEIHNKEFLAIIDLIQEWHHLLEDASHLVMVYNDYKILSIHMLLYFELLSSLLEYVIVWL